MNFTLNELLDNYKVIVPQIQRDYAQGRNSESDLRKGFVNQIKKSLEPDSLSLNLDFVYGYTENTGNGTKAFIPLDGQQRLTTLWLIHWFVAPREETQPAQFEKRVLTDEAQDYLKSFTYETRISSKRFCYSLITQPLYIGENIVLSQSIKDASWFMASWNNDPTIISMLNMIDTLQEETFNKEEAWDSLLNGRKITFDYIDIKSDEFRLTDELYIKMNSRGKPLTPFENFKAQFSGLLSSKTTDYVNLKRSYQGAEITYQQYFAFKIDSVWMDLFWDYRTKVDFSIDDNIYRFINYISEFLFFKNNPNAAAADVKYDFDFLNKIFSTRENIDFLFDSFDFLSEIDNVKSFFESLFKEVSTFDDYSTDYFLRAISGKGFDVKDKTILYAILSYGIQNKTYTPDDDFRDFIRILRNLLFSVRQPNQGKRVEYSSNLRMPNVSDYCKFVDEFVKQKNENKITYETLTEHEFAGFTKENIANEKVKAGLIVSNSKLKAKIHSLEEHAQIQGNTANFKLSSDDIAQKIDAFLQIWSDDVDDSMITRAYLTIADYSVKTHDSSSLDEIWYFGSKGNWNRIITSSGKDEREKVTDSLDSFLASFINAKGNSTIEKLQFLIDNFKSDFKQWRYYFVKYNAMNDNEYYKVLSNNTNAIKLNLYSWVDETGFNINNLGNSGNQPLHSYHLNPYLITLKKHFQSSYRVTLYWGRFTDLSILKIDEKIHIRCLSAGWRIFPMGNYTIDPLLIAKYNLTQHGSEFILSESEIKDRIEIGIDFINEILK